MGHPVTLHPLEKTRFNEVFQLQTATIVLTTACNLRCDYCFESFETSLLKPHQATALIDALYANHKAHYGADSTLGLSLFGGEPLLAWRSIVAMYDRIRERGYKVSTGITTNLTLLTDEIIELIDEEQIGLLISIDGLPEIHNRNRDNSYDNVEANVKRLLAADCGHLLQARMTVQPQDFESMLAGIQSLYELGFDNIACVPVTDTVWTPEQIAAFKAAADATFAWVLERYEDSSSRRNLAVTLVEQNLYVNTAADADLELIPCTMGGTRWLAIAPNGDLYPCHQIPSRPELKPSLCLGNVFEDRIDDAKLLGEIQPGSWEKHTLEFDCRDCPAKVTCRGSCPAENLSESGWLGMPTDAWCHQTQALYEITCKWHDKILNAGNIRNRVINKLKANLELMHEVQQLLNSDPEHPLYLSRVMRIHGVLAGNESLVLPAFQQYFVKAIDTVLSRVECELAAMKEQ